MKELQLIPPSYSVLVRWTIHSHVPAALALAHRVGLSRPVLPVSSTEHCCVDQLPYAIGDEDGLTLAMNDASTLLKGFLVELVALDELPVPLMEMFVTETKSAEAEVVRDSLAKVEDGGLWLSTYEKEVGQWRQGSLISVILRRSGRTWSVVQSRLCHHRKS